jgi:hypothetical protein
MSLQTPAEFVRHASTWSILWGISLITTVRLNVEENQLVNVFGEFGICLERLKSA